VFGDSPSTPPEIGQALAELGRLGQDQPSLAAARALLSDILPGLFTEPVQEAAPSLATDHAVAKLAAGIPLLRGEVFQLDVRGFRKRWQYVCSMVERHQGAAAAKALTEGLCRDRLVPAELLQAVLAGRPEDVHARVDALGLDAGLTATVLRLTMFPVLAQINSALAPLRAGVPWHHGYCPTCGSWPLLGEYRGLEQTRWLRCGLCAAAWEFARLQCPFCGTRDHRQLGYFHVDEAEPKHRAATCDACRGYVKMVSTLTGFSGPQLLVADLATLFLDLAAAERGYAVP
jgi:FdhE protein